MIGRGRRNYGKEEWKVEGREDRKERGMTRGKKCWWKEREGQVGRRHRGMKREIKGRVGRRREGERVGGREVVRQEREKRQVGREEQECEQVGKVSGERIERKEG